MKITRWLAASAALALLAVPVAQAQSDAALKADATTPGDILTCGMGYNYQRYSALKPRLVSPGQRDDALGELALLDG